MKPEEVHEKVLQFVDKASKFRIDVDYEEFHEIWRTQNYPGQMVVDHYWDKFTLVYEHDVVLFLSSMPEDRCKMFVDYIMNNY